MAACLDYKVVTPHCCLLGEGPVWDSGTKTICWVDILNGKIHQFSLIENKFYSLNVGELVGAIAITSNGDFIAALKCGLAFVDRKTGGIIPISNPEMHLPENRFNDGKCDPSGRFWVGSMSLTEKLGAGSLYTIEKNLEYSVKIKDVTISNGLAWSPDHTTFYYIDTPTYQVAAYDYNEETGNITNKRIAISVPEKEGYPDGMTIDNEGMLWIAHWDGWQVTRWDPNSGRKLLSIPLPVARITSCTFGGNDLKDLYITSASIGLTEKLHNEQRLAGSLFVISNCGYQGIEPVIFDYNKEK
jgi:sugar lactone lactonase YvrE